MSIGLAEARDLIAAAQRRAIEVGKPITVDVNGVKATYTVSKPTIKR